MKELLRRCASGEFMGGKVHCVEMDSTDLHNPDYVLAKVAKDVRGFKFKESDRQKLKAFGLNMLLGQIGGGGISYGESARPRSSPFLASFPDDLFRSAAEGLIKRGRAFVFVVGEAQGIVNTPGSDGNGLLKGLHLGRGLPIVPVLIGQPNTQKKLENTISASRWTYGNEPCMVGLTDEEAGEYVDGMFDWLEVDGAEAERNPWREWLVKECEGWPHHLSNAMKSVAEGLLEADSMRLSDLNGAVVAEALSARRADYYVSRANFRTEVNSAIDAVRSLIDEVNGDENPIMGAKMRDRVKQALAECPPDEPVTSDDLIDALAMSGILARKRRRRVGLEWICPITSLSSFLKDGFHETKHPFPPMGADVGTGAPSLSPCP